MRRSKQAVGAPSWTATAAAACEYSHMKRLVRRTETRASGRAGALSDRPSRRPHSAAAPATPPGPAAPVTSRATTEVEPGCIGRACQPGPCKWLWASAVRMHSQRQWWALPAGTARRPPAPSVGTPCCRPAARVGWCLGRMPAAAPCHRRRPRPAQRQSAGHSCARPPAECMSIAA